MNRSLVSATAAPILAAAALALSSAGCVSASRQEQAAREQLRQADALRPIAGGGAELAGLKADAPLADYLRFALLNHPAVEAAYDDWRAAVLAIGPARALPDPKLTFQADIAGTLASLMPGFMFDLMAPGKRAAMAGEATAAAEAARRQYVSAVLATAADVKKSWADLTAQEDLLRLRRRMLGLKEEAVRFAHAEHVTMHAMGSLDEMTRLLNEAGQLRLEVANLEDERGVLRARFKSALGLRRDAPDPPWPDQFVPSPAPASDDAFWQAALAANPRLGEMRAMVAMAVAEAATARRARTPDLGAGLMADLKMAPVLWRPLAELSLPVWRRKIADAVASADARRDAAAARLTAEELMVAADLARMTAMVREADRMVAYIDETALPNLRQSYATVAAAYGTGMTGFAMIPETQEMVLAMQGERVAALRDREKALADLSLLVAGEAPAGAPLPPATVAAGNP